ncbi:MAG TPA: hypothetical protein VI455_11940 [Terriglobia bacterium]
MPGSMGSIRVSRLILLPAVITLAVTILRLVGELQHWPSVYFNPGNGGRGAIVGIVWLPLIFGPYFALKLTAAGEGPSSAVKAIGFAAGGWIAMMVGAGIAFLSKATWPKILLGVGLMAMGTLIQLVPWKALAKTLLAYAYAARIPVLIITYFAMQGRWGTHYDVEYTGGAGFWTQYLELGVIPQLIFWVAYTVLAGALLGGIAAALTRRGRRAAQPAPS